MTNNKHLIAVDLDGTLLSDDKKVSQRNKAALQEAMKQGHEVVIATGRPFRASYMYYQEVGMTTPIVNFNGAFVHHPQNDNWGTFHEPLSLDVVKEVIQVSEKYQIHNILAEVMDDVYFHFHDEKLLDIFGFGNPRMETGDLKQILKKDPTSVLIHASEDEVEKIRKYLSEVHAEVIDHRRWAAPWHVIEIVRSGINKAVGLKKVADYYNIPTSNIIAFGDEDNDFEMIEFAGVGVAMGNAIPQLKERANVITKTNEENGIAHFLEKNLL
ncbi:Cof-type HAD-IIB family hydrolase [Sutcliffiella cohnii]|uniref:Cof-type HAD-IIB family hydrolase n=1 Tax=Sutcliffiella cohnii TaxID=33932 RepID=UPI002E1FF14A|nr:Cof-type HAD-IIB family hydrolase [Sutcliffiella cohnii]